MGETMSIRDALAATAALLEGISVPAWMIREIGIPVSGAISNLRACIEAIDNQEKEAKEDEADV